jgi:hypothetical protein
MSEMTKTRHLSSVWQCIAGVDFIKHFSCVTHSNYVIHLCILKTLYVSMLAIYDVIASFARAMGFACKTVYEINHRPDMVSQLLEHGADVSAKDSESNTALHVAGTLG